MSAGRDPGSRGDAGDAAAGRVVVGIVGKPFGLRGACYVRPDPDVDHGFDPGTRYDVAGRTGARQLEVADRADHGSRLVLRFAGVEDRTGAEELRGAVLAVDRSDIDLDGEWLWADDVLGAEVVDDAGRIVGVVEAVEDGPAHDYLVVARPDATAVWIPAVAELVTVSADRVVVTALPGLLDPEVADPVADAAVERSTGDAPPA